METISARLKILELMGNMLRAIVKFSPADLIPTLYICTNKVYPAHTGIELGLGDSLLMRAISESTGRSIEKLKSGARPPDSTALLYISLIPHSDLKITSNWVIGV